MKNPTVEKLCGASLASYVAVFRVWGAPPPLNVGVFSWFLIHLALVVLAICLKNKKIRKEKGARLSIPKALCPYT